MKTLNKHEKALERVLLNLSKAVLKIKCSFNFLSAQDDELGYTYRQKIMGTKKETAIVSLNREHLLFLKLDEDKRDVATFGVAIHELLHQKFTNFDAFLKKLKNMVPAKQKLFKNIFNVFEDSRIEYFANQAFGGKALAALKYTINLTWEESPEIDNTLPPPLQVINALIQYGDTGKIKGDFSDDDTRNTFLKCCEWFDKAIVSTSCKDCISYAAMCTDYLYDKYGNSIPDDFSDLKPDDVSSCNSGKGEDTKEQKSGSKAANAKQQNRKATKQQQSSNSSENSSGGSSQNEDKEDKKNNGSENSSGKSDDKEENDEGNDMDTSSDDNADENSDGSENGKGSNNSDEEDESEDSSDNKASGNRNEEGENSDSENTSDGGNDNDNSDEEGQEVSYDNYVFEEEDIDDFAEELSKKLEAANEAIESEIKTSEGDTYTFRLEDAECDTCLFKEVSCDEEIYNLYQEYANNNDIGGLSDELAKDMEVILKTRPTGWERSKNGKLNIKRWNDPNFNSPYIFDKRLSNESAIAVSILIDESGSMDNKIDKVRQMASVLAECFMKLNIKFNILGHTGGEAGSTINTIREYSDFDSNVFEQVVTIDARDYNFDGASIKVAADKLAKREERNKLMFVLTDGASHNVANTELAIRDANKIGTVVGVALCCGSSASMIEKMYGDKFITVESMNDLMERITDKLKEVSCLWS